MRPTGAGLATRDKLLSDIQKMLPAEKRTTAEMKWSATNNEARSILAKETRERERKTERLRQARLAQEKTDEKAAADAPKPTPARARSRKSAGR